MLSSSENTRSHDAEFGESANAMRAGCDHAGNCKLCERLASKNCTKIARKLRHMDEYCTKIARIASEEKCAEIAQQIARKIDLGQ